MAVTESLPDSRKPAVPLKKGDDYESDFRSSYPRFRIHHWHDGHDGHRGY
jgi:hypothetical protein